MSEIFQLQCKHCGSDLHAKEQYRLNRSHECSPSCRFQDLIIGHCSDCKKTEYAWLEIDYMDEVIRVHRIAPKNFEKWDKRIETDQVHRITIKGAGSVQGSKSIFPWTFMPMIPVR
jgi:hypothetical protein